MFLLSQKEREKQLGDAEGNPKQETMNRKKLIQDLHVIAQLLDALVVRTQEKRERNKEVRKLLKLPRTVHNKVRITNYIKNGSQ